MACGTTNLQGCNSMFMTSRSVHSQQVFPSFFGSSQRFNSCFSVVAALKNKSDIFNISHTTLLNWNMAIETKQRPLQRQTLGIIDLTFYICASYCITQKRLWVVCVSYCMYHTFVFRLYVFFPSFRVSCRHALTRRALFSPVHVLGICVKPMYDREARCHYLSLWTEIRELMI